MFESLLKNLDPVFRRLRGRGKVSEANTRDALREIRLALLEADVSYKVVKQFTSAVLERATGTEVVRSVSPGQQFVKVVYDELVQLMGPVDHEIPFQKDGVTVIMLVGLQGSGKTTSAAKLAKYLAAKGRQPLLVAADVQRPAAIEQLRVLGSQLGYPVYAQEGGRPPKICQRAVKFAQKEGCDCAILDTAGRLHVDEPLMLELKEIVSRVKPAQIYLVCDAMTGQDAVNSAVAFHERLKIDGVILTKLDGDARGGAALSIKAVTQCPVKFAGVGEQLDRLEEFHPDRMASRILGMGDVVTLVEKAQAALDTDEAEALRKKLLKKTFTLEDFLKHLQHVKKIGPIKELMGMIPGMGGIDVETAQQELPRIEAIIQSMTPGERQQPELIDGSRRRRISRGSATDTTEVNQLLKQFRQMKKVMRQFASMKVSVGEAAGAGSPNFGGFGPAGGQRRSKPRRRKRRR